MKIVVFTCDKYSWLIPTFWHFYKKNWQNNPYEIEFVTETKKLEFGYSIFYPGKILPNSVSIFYAGKIPWADRAIKYLKQSNEDKFLLLLDDYILNNRIDSSKVKIAEDLCRDKIGCVKLTVHNKYSKFLIQSEIDGFKEYPTDKPYPISLQAAIWQKSFFLDILKEHETIWETEVNGSKRVQEYDKKIIWSDTPIIDYYSCGYMKKGKPVEEVVKWVEENWGRIETISEIWNPLYSRLGEVDPKNPRKNKVIRESMDSSTYGKFADMAVNKLKAQDSVLEIGCGYGGLCSEILKRIQVSYTVVENKPMLEQTKKFLIEKAEYKDATEIETLLNRKFDLFIANFCLTETPLEYAEYILKNLIKNCRYILISDIENELLEKYLDKYFTFTKTCHRKDTKQFVYIGERKVI